MSKSTISLVLLIHPTAHAKINRLSQSAPSAQLCIQPPNWFTCLSGANLSSQLPHWLHCATSYMAARVIFLRCQCENVDHFHSSFLLPPHPEEADHSPRLSLSHLDSVPGSKWFGHPALPPANRAPAQGCPS